MSMIKLALFLLFKQTKKVEHAIHMLIWNSITCKYAKQNEIYEMNACHHKLNSA